MKARRIWIAMGIVLLVAGGAATFSLLRVHGSLAGITSRTHTLWDTLQTIFPWTGRADTLRPEMPDFRFEALSEADLEVLREIADASDVAGLPEFTWGDPGRRQGSFGATTSSGAGVDAQAPERAAPEPVRPPPRDEPVLVDQPGRINVLLLGIRGERVRNGGLLADAIVVASLDTTSMRAALVSIPRDLYVEIPEVGGHYKINAAHAIGEMRFGQGLEFAMKTVSNVAGIPMHYGVRVDTIAFERLIERLGGVDVDVERPFVGTEDEGISFAPGTVRMDAETALKYARSRFTTNDFDRSRRQREIMEAIKDRVIELGNPLVLLDLLDAASEHVETTMSTQEMRTLVSDFADRGLADLHETGFDASESGPLRAARSQHGEYILVPRAGSYAEVRTVFRDIFE